MNHDAATIILSRCATRLNSLLIKRLSQQKEGSGLRITLLLLLLVMMAACSSPDDIRSEPRAVIVTTTPISPNATQPPTLRPTQTGTPTPFPTRTFEPTPRAVTVSRINDQIDPRLVTPIAEGELLPDLVLTDIDGNPIHLRTYATIGRPMVINFWSVGCGSCFYEFPILRDMMLFHGRENLAVISINIADFADETRIIADQLGANFPVVVDQDAALFATYFNGAVVPTTIFVHADGRVSQVMVGAVDAYNVDLQLQALGLPSALDAQP